MFKINTNVENLIINNNNLTTLVEKISTKTINNNNEFEKKKVMHNGKNLANVYASAPNTYVYVTTVMRMLFTQKELFSGLIIEENKPTKSTRTPLDLAKVQRLKG
jgi:hypothetical protein